MAEYVEPESEYTSRVFGLATGLTGTIRFRLIDNDGNANDPIYGPATAGIIEDPSGSGSYVFRSSAVAEVAPATEAKYSRVWDSGAATELVPDEDLIVLAGVAALIGGTGDLYITAADLKKTLTLEGTTFADDDIDLACSAASRAIDGYKGQRFYPTTETREFTGDRYDDWIDIGPVTSVSSVTVDLDGSGAYGTTWVAGTDFALDPPNAADDGIPYRRILLLKNAGRRFPDYANSVRVTGSFGWTTTPPQVAQAAKLLANRFVKRARETPYGILVVAGDAVTAARLGRIDPDVAFLLDNLPGARTPLMV